MRRGFFYLWGCCVVFLAALTDVIVAPQYSHCYYVGWVVAIASALLILPSVLPCDSTRIAVFLEVSIGNTACIVFFSAWKSYYFWLELRSGDCARMHGSAMFCGWTSIYWCIHTLIALAFLFIWIHASIKLKPAIGLNRFWRCAGIYFIIVGIVSLIDKGLCHISGAYTSRSQFIGRIFWWNIVITIEEFVLGALCLSNRFKSWIWRRTASSANITEHCACRPTGKICIDRPAPNYCTQKQWHPQQQESNYQVAVDLVQCSGCLCDSRQLRTPATTARTVINESYTPDVKIAECYVRASMKVTSSP